MESKMEEIMREKGKGRGASREAWVAMINAHHYKCVQISC